MRFTNSNIEGGITMLDTIPNTEEMTVLIGQSVYICMAKIMCHD